MRTTACWAFFALNVTVTEPFGLAATSDNAGFRHNYAN